MTRQMPGITFKVTGKLLADAERRALLISSGGERYLLRLGFVRRGTEDVILPETLLDDWGHEIGGAPLYHWVKENASRFPRAELFGFDLAGRPQQSFVRELDLTARFPCYAYESASTALSDGVQVNVILVPAVAAGRHTHQGAPDSISFPLRAADVEWRLVARATLEQIDQDFHHLLEADESG